MTKGVWEITIASGISEITKTYGIWEKKESALIFCCVFPTSLINRIDRVEDAGRNRQWLDSSLNRTAKPRFDGSVRVRLELPKLV